jgi:TusA-related sulfurtransferase
VDPVSPVVVDARGLLCPLPVIRVQDRAQDLEPGTLVEAIGTDPGILNDIPAWCQVNGHRVLETRRIDRDYLVLIRLGDA